MKILNSGSSCEFWGHYNWLLHIDAELRQIFLNQLNDMKPELAKKQPKILNVWCRISSFNCFILCAIFLWNYPGGILNPKIQCQPASAQPNFKTLHSYAIFIDSFPSTKPTCIKVDDETLAGFQCHIHFGS